MKHKSLIQKVRDSLTEKPHTQKQTMLHWIANKLLRSHVSEKTGIQQITEQHKRIVEQHNQKFFNAKAESTTNGDKANFISHMEGEGHEHF